MRSLYLQRHAESESGDRMDPTRPLTAHGEHQAAVMADFMVRQVGRVDLVLSSYFRRARDTAAIMAKALGAEVSETFLLEPDVPTKKAWHAIGDLTNLLVVTHHPLVNDLMAMLTGAKTGDEQFHHAHIAHIVDGKLHWFVGPKLVERDDREVAEAAARVADAILAEMGYELHFDEARKQSYYYDIQNVKRWVLGPGGKAGNCEICIENAELGDVDDDATFLSAGGADIDSDPAHPNCTCLVEYREKRVRVYV